MRRRRRGALQPCGGVGVHAHREQFGRPLAEFQLTQRKLTDPLIEVNRAALVVLRIGRLKDTGRLHRQSLGLCHGLVAGPCRLSEDRMRPGPEISRERPGR
ncbi:acyl-CoA dehydrogenase family protein [Streptomyces sp. NPDC051677]|uniref:acyl-CoA dehydrogenase family protein n=1 Tax=Streptomyces sp. NPDC051677 TaxID=3365669 RepID=UPI0037D8653C